MSKLWKNYQDSFFILLLRLQEDYGRSVFLINSLEWNFKRELKHVKKIEVFWLLHTIARGFVFIQLFLKEQKIEVWQNFL